MPTYREEAKKRILQAALEAFKEKGYSRSTMDDIADRLGISKGAIYQYFDGKESLLAALYTGAPENLRSRFSAEAGKDLIDASKDVFNEMATKANASLFVDFLAEASRNIEFQKILRENIGEFARVLEDILSEDDKKTGREEVERIHDAVVTLGLVFNGLSCWLAVGVPSGGGPGEVGEGGRDRPRAGRKTKKTHRSFGPAGQDRSRPQELAS